MFQNYLWSSPSTVVIVVMFQNYLWSSPGTVVIVVMFQNYLWSSPSTVVIVVMFQNYLRSSPSTVVIDPLEAINKLLDRHEQYRHVAECSVVEEGNHYVLLLLRIYRISLNTTRVSN